MFNASHGSLFVAFLFHAQLNGPWPDAQPWDTYLFVVIALVIFVVNRKAMLSREAGSTEVLLNRDELVTSPRPTPLGVDDQPMGPASSLPQQV